MRLPPQVRVFTLLGLGVSCAPSSGAVVDVTLDGRPFRLPVSDLDVDPGPAGEGEGLRVYARNPDARIRDTNGAEYVGLDVSLRLPPGSGTFPCGPEAALFGSLDIVPLQPVACATTCTVSVAREPSPTGEGDLLRGSFVRVVGDDACRLAHTGYPVRELRGTFLIPSTAEGRRFGAPP